MQIKQQNYTFLYTISIISLYHLQFYVQYNILYVGKIQLYVK